MAGYAGWENNEVRPFRGTNGLQVQALSQTTCELTIGVQVFATSAVATRFFDWNGVVPSYQYDIISMVTT